MAIYFMVGNEPGAMDGMKLCQSSNVYSWVIIQSSHTVTDTAKNAVIVHTH